MFQLFSYNIINPILNSFFIYFSGIIFFLLLKLCLARLQIFCTAPSTIFNSYMLYGVYRLIEYKPKINLKWIQQVFFLLQRFFFITIITVIIKCCRWYIYSKIANGNRKRKTKLFLGTCVSVSDLKSVLSENN